MSDFLTQLVFRAQGQPPSVRPRSVPRFAPGLLVGLNTPFGSIFQPDSLAQSPWSECRTAAFSALSYPDTPEPTPESSAREARWRSPLNLSSDPENITAFAVLPERKNRVWPEVNEVHESIKPVSSVRLETPPASSIQTSEPFPKAYSHVYPVEAAPDKPQGRSEPTPSPQPLEIFPADQSNTQIAQTLPWHSEQKSEPEILKPHDRYRTTVVPSSEHPLNLPPDSPQSSEQLTSERHPQWDTPSIQTSPTSSEAIASQAPGGELANTVPLKKVVGWEKQGKQGKQGSKGRKNYADPNSIDELAARQRQSPLNHDRDITPRSANLPQTQASVPTIKSDHPLAPNQASQSPSTDAGAVEMPIRRARQPIVPLPSSHSSLAAETAPASPSSGLPPLTPARAASPIPRSEPALTAIDSSRTDLTWTNRFPSNASRRDSLPSTAASSEAQPTIKVEAAPDQPQGRSEPTPSPQTLEIFPVDQSNTQIAQTLPWHSEQKSEPEILKPHERSPVPQSSSRYRTTVVPSSEHPLNLPPESPQSSEQLTSERPPQWDTPSIQTSPTSSEAIASQAPGGELANTVPLRKVVGWEKQGEQGSKGRRNYADPNSIDELAARQRQSPLNHDRDITPRSANLPQTQASVPTIESDHPLAQNQASQSPSTDAGAVEMPIRRARQPIVPLPSSHSSLAAETAPASPSSGLPPLTPARAASPIPRSEPALTAINSSRTDLTWTDRFPSKASHRDSLPSKATSSEARPTIEISIGRIEVRAKSATPNTSRTRNRSSTKSPKISLSAYLKNRNESN